MSNTIRPLTSTKLLLAHTDIEPPVVPVVVSTVATVVEPVELVATVVTSLELLDAIVVLPVPAPVLEVVLFVLFVVSCVVGLCAITGDVARQKAQRPTKAIRASLPLDDLMMEENKYLQFIFGCFTS